MQYQRFYFRMILGLLSILSTNCLIQIHENSQIIPIENGYQYNCDSKLPRDELAECIENYTAKRFYLRDESRSTIRAGLIQRRSNTTKLESWKPR
jgi:hypothetical protein